MTTIANKPKTTLQERTNEATEKLREILGLETLTAADVKILTAALTQVAAEEINHNSSFVTRLKFLFNEMKPAKSKEKPAEEIYTGEDLIPIASMVGNPIDPLGIPDPQTLLKMYGVCQLPKALSIYKPTKLKIAAEQLMTTHPGTKPKTKTKKEDLISYIVSLVS
jgi:hypothetical protein